MTVRVRYAPSPTGHLHIGGVRTALFNYLFAKHHQGQFILRIEDTDLDRNVPEAETEMLEGFRWLGFDWDEGPDIGGTQGPYRCTERLEIYDSFLEKLKDTGYAYPCFCTPDQLESDRQAALAEGRAVKYSGRCRRLSAAEQAGLLSSGRAHTWRFAVSPGHILSIEDLVHGHVEFATDDLGDFVIVKSDGIPTYNFQVVVDDALMDITHVIRGEEHLSNTPRQLVIYEALGMKPPQFAHLPQVLNTNRKKLSKRDPDVLPIESYRQQGYLPEALVNFLALLGWSPAGEEELFSLEELVKVFDLDRVNRSGAIFNVEKLQWMAKEYMKRMDVGQVTELVADDLSKRGIHYPPGCGREWLQVLVGLYQEQMTCTEDFAQLAGNFFDKSVDWDEEALEVMQSDLAQKVIGDYLSLVEQENADWTSESSRMRFKQVQKDLGVKGRDLYMPVRAAATGMIHGRDLQMTIAALPKDWVVYRMRTALSIVAERG